jgi:hypothetical protein
MSQITKLQMKNEKLQPTTYNVSKFASNKTNKNKNHKSYTTKLQIYTLQY